MSHQGFISILDVDFQNRLFLTSTTFFSLAVAFSRTVILSHWTPLDILRTV